jgi:hypothetical protein
LLYHISIILNFSTLQTKIAFLESEILKQKIESDEKYNIGVAEARELEKEKQHGTVEELKLR